jgi:hypothetical protein
MIPSTSHTYAPLPFSKKRGDAPSGYIMADFENVCEASGIEFNALSYKLFERVNPLPVLELTSSP